MCVIVFKPAGAEAPAMNVLEDCWSSNPDGAGLAVAEKDHVYVRKGFMKLKDFKDFYDKWELKDRVSQAMMFHFRIGTHGLKDAGNTHPFPVSPNPAVLRKLEGRYPTAVAHNGIFQLKVSLPEVSDTGQFMADCFMDKKTPEEYWKDNPSIRGWSRLVIMRPGGRYKLLGDWHCEADDGCFYSNLSWKCSKYTPKWQGSTGHGMGFAYQGGCYTMDDYADADYDGYRPAAVIKKDDALTERQLQEEEDYFNRPRYSKYADKLKAHKAETVKAEAAKAEADKAEADKAPETEPPRNWLGGDMSLPMKTGAAATLSAADDVLKRGIVKTTEDSLRKIIVKPRTEIRCLVKH